MVRIEWGKILNTICKSRRQFRIWNRRSFRVINPNLYIARYIKNHAIVVSRCLKQIRNNKLAQFANTMTNWKGVNSIAFIQFLKANFKYALRIHDFGWHEILRTASVGMHFQENIRNPLLTKFYRND